MGGGQGRLFLVMSTATPQFSGTSRIAVIAVSIIIIS
jgi:hypothetical protein